jgi:hypothetical protein
MPSSLVPNENKLALEDLPIGTRVKLPELVLHGSDPDDVWEITSHGEFVELKNQDGEEGGCGGDVVPKMISAPKGARPPGSGIPLKEWSEDDPEQGRLYVGLRVITPNPKHKPEPPEEDEREQDVLVQPHIPDRGKRLAEIRRRRSEKNDSTSGDDQGGEA